MKNTRFFAQIFPVERGSERGWAGRPYLEVRPGGRPGAIPP
jgi:hypothetical protein